MIEAQLIAGEKVIRQKKLIALKRYDIITGKPYYLNKDSFEWVFAKDNKKVRFYYTDDEYEEIEDLFFYNSPEQEDADEAICGISVKAVEEEDESRIEEVTTAEMAKALVKYERLYKRRGSIFLSLYCS